MIRAGSDDLSDFEGLPEKSFRRGGGSEGDPAAGKEGAARGAEAEAEFEIDLDAEEVDFSSADESDEGAGNAGASDEDAEIIGPELFEEGDESEPIDPSLADGSERAFLEFSPPPARKLSDEEAAALAARIEDSLEPSERAAPDPEDADEASGDAALAASRLPAERAQVVVAASETSPASEAPRPALDANELQAAIEAILFSSGEPITIRALAEVFEVSVHEVREAVEKLRQELDDSQRSFRLFEIAGGLQFFTQPRFEAWVNRFAHRRREQRLSGAALETLAVIAYKQPISRAALEEIRGVQCGPILKTLLDRDLIRIAGHDQGLGRALLYGTTATFLERFGLASLEHLPQPELEHPRDQPIGG